MKKILFFLLNYFAILNTILASYHVSLIRRGLGQNGDVSYYINNVAAISKDLMKNNDPKEDCVFYVNSYDSNEREKKAAIAFAEIRNAQLAASGGTRTANTLYDAFDMDVAFGDVGTLMREAEAGGEKFRRKYFRVTSGEYAKLCRGTVWLIARKDQPIYDQSIWITDEYPQLIRSNSGVREIFQIDPAEIEAALLLDDLDRDLHPSPYRGHRPPGANPPRSIGPIPYKKGSKPSIDAKINEYSRYPDVANGYLDPEGTVSPKCDMSDSSQVPFNVFKGVFGRFCDNTLNNPLNRLTQIVDSQGYVIPIKNKRLVERTPPPNPDSYKDYKFDLSWSGGKGLCRLGCKDAFNAATDSPCGHTAGEQNIMSTSGTIDAGCGEYRWDIIIPPGAKPAPSPSPPTVSAVKCNAADAFGKHKDISPGFQKQSTVFACLGSALKNIKPGDPDISFRTVTNGTPYNYKISWLPGCKSTVSQMNVYQPLPNDSKNTCLSLLLKVYTDCNNGGVGGSIDVGCVRYEFHP